MHVGVEIGDEVFVVEGASVPLVLRAVPGSCLYRLVGRAYVHGFMGGEVMDMAENNEAGDKRFKSLQLV
jgi:hypothetical protein